MKGLVTAFFLALLVVTPARAADRFYEDLLRDGINAIDAGDAPRATKLLRLACFGLLEEPKVLGRCLVRLALAEAKMNDGEAFSATFLRILEVENRFKGYSQANLRSTIRRRFEAHVRDGIRPELLARSPTFRSLARSEQADRPLDEEAPPVAPVRSGSEVEAVPEGNPKIAAALDAAREAQRRGNRKDLRRELDRLRPLLEQHAGRADLHHAAASLAYRLGLWKESVAHFEAGGEIDAGQTVLLFYYAVVLYETGDVDQAAKALERALPKLKRNPFVEEYIEKILGPQG